MGCQQACALQPSHHTLRALKDRLVRDQGRSPPHKHVDIEKLRRFMVSNTSGKRESPNSSDREEDTLSGPVEQSREPLQKDLYRREVIQNFLSKDPDYNIIQLHDKLIFLEDDTTQKEFSDQELLRLLANHQISLGSFLAGNRKQILESLQLSQSNEKQTKKEKIIAEFNKEPLYVDVLTHFREVRDTIFDD